MHAWPLRALAVAGLLGLLAGGGLGAGAAAAASPQVVVGSLQVTFASQVQSGEIVAESNGMDAINPGFTFETGQATSGWTGNDLQLGSDANGQPALTGNVAVLPSNDELPTVPSGATVPATPGETLLVLDSAGNYVLVGILSASSQAVKFQYAMQSSVEPLQPPASAPQPAQQPAPQPAQQPAPQPAQQPAPQPAQQPAPQPAQQPAPQPAPQPTPSQGSSASGSGSGSGSGEQGVYAMPGNCVAITDGSGGQALQVGVIVTAMFADQGQTVAQATAGRALVLNVAIKAPTDVTKVSVQQSGEIGGNAWTTPLHPDPLGQNTANDWTFSMQQTDLSKPYQIMITSATLAADGIADPSTAVTELDWNFDPTPGCGGGSQGGQASQSGQSQETPPAQAGNAQAPGQPASPSVTIALQIGSTTATVDGQSQTLAVPAQIDPAGRTLVPFRFLGQALGATVSWDGSSHTASYQLGSTDVAVTIGKSTALVGGKSVTLDAPPVIVDGSTLVPVRFVSEALGATVSWDASTQTVTITYAPPSGQSGG